MWWSREMCPDRQTPHARRTSVGDSVGQGPFYRLSHVVRSPLHLNYYITKVSTFGDTKFITFVSWPRSGPARRCHPLSPPVSLCPLPGCHRAGGYRRRSGPICVSRASPPAGAHPHIPTPKRHRRQNTRPVRAQLRRACVFSRSADRPTGAVLSGLSKNGPQPRSLRS